MIHPVTFGFWPFQSPYDHARATADYMENNQLKRIKIDEFRDLELKVKKISLLPVLPEKAGRLEVVG